MLVHSLEQPQVLEARSIAGPDPDGDGLIDLQEEVLGLNSLADDSDGDTWTDLEEIARHGHPMEFSIRPDPTVDFSVGMYAREDAGHLTIGSAVFVANGQIRSIEYELGLVLEGSEIVPIPQGVYVAATCVRLVQPPNGGLIIIMEAEIPTTFVQTLGSLGVFMKLIDPQNPSHVITADVLNLYVFPSGVVAAVDPEVDPDPGQGSFGPSGGGGSTQYGGPTTRPGGLIYTPLTGGEHLPTAFSSNQICSQSTEILGVDGSSYILGVRSAGCLESDSYCSPGDCGSNVGSTVEILDPQLLIGG